MSGHVKSAEHCSKPRRLRRWKHRVWWCDCGKAWRPKRAFCGLYMDGSDCWTWTQVSELDYTP